MKNYVAFIIKKPETTPKITFVVADSPGIALCYAAFKQEDGKVSEYNMSELRNIREAEIEKNLDEKMSLAIACTALSLDKTFGYVIEIPDIPVYESCLFKDVDISQLH